VSIQAEGKFTLADVWRGARLASRRMLVSTTLIGLLLLAALLFLGIFSPKFLREQWLLIVLSVFWASYLWIFLLYSSYRTLKKSPNLQGTVRYQFDDSGYRLEALHTQAEVKWGAMVKWREGKYTFLFYSNPRIASVIPKRFFQSSADVDAVRNFLRTHVSRK